MKPTSDASFPRVKSESNLRVSAAVLRRRNTYTYNVDIQNLPLNDVNFVRSGIS